ncbi:hypothetical protein [Pectobacterium punjabense]|uniref:hypothetical protein n=1 Tax=Pectobacterium punjabense TaxID=2108399 RepID=UPI001968B69C|nr:hypothetical protein [Pectobacterium punjabense]MBN3138001.1 hypothetical protein [Pectobacterium punjabense]MCE5381990.1 hypothetical protein [Pectobacterium punjabense]
MSDFLVVELISKDIIHFYDKDQIKKGNCYSNIFCISSEIYSQYRIVNFDNAYVLCYVDGVPHCILKYKGIYYDPTLQVHDCIKDRKYVLVKEFNYIELHQYIKEHDGIGWEDGEKYYVPPRLTVKGEITCTECSKP